MREPCEEGVVRAGQSAAPPGPVAERWVLAATILGSSMAFIDGTAVNVALPALQRNLGATVADVQWVVEIYALFLSALLLVGGSLGDRFGRRRVFLSGVAGFAAASAACGLAPGVGDADRRARRAGDRRRPDGAGEPGPALGVLRSGAPRAGDRHLVRLRLDHGGGGAADGRLADRSRLLALGVLPQSPAGRGGDRHLAPLRAGEPGRSGRGEDRLSGRAPRHAGLERPDLRPHRVAAAGLGEPAGLGGPARGLRRAPRLPRGGVPDRRPDDAALPLPARAPSPAPTC